MTNDYFFSYWSNTIKCICGITFSIDNPKLIYCPSCGQAYNKLDKFEVVIGD